MSDRPTVLVLDEEFATALPSIESDVDLVGREALEEPATAAKVQGLITQFEPVDAELLDRLPSLRAVVKMGQSYHNVDVDTLRARDVPLFLSPRKGPNCVAELAMTFMLALSKDLLTSHRAVAEGAYRLRGLKPERSEQWKMAFHWMRHATLHEVRGKTVGIVGMGEIGCELALRAVAMGMKVVYHKRTPLSPELEARFRAKRMPLPALLADSDYVVLAVPHTTDTERMIGAGELAAMKEGAFLVNICRGGVVDEDALIEALASRSIAGAGLDVFTYEPLPADSPLCTLDNVILTPHVGGGSGSNRALEVTEAAQAAAEAIEGREGGAAWRIP
ncbi:MAG TPA: NAD(P)-dependent oxidoreductase [Longimicrobiales bacterium]|nr:NAD(P)-dependent oxidoreductase [Longimicrobiales bacterium]